ncbi:MAG TPA: signal peptide peptidase SppA [Candidatus Saccharimonadales bacterium]|nr:signal peptide peptidase SppA [Candidatus Saccharimonadales bacterium]
MTSRPSSNDQTDPAAPATGSMYPAAPLRSSVRERISRVVPGFVRLFPTGRVAVIRLHGPIGGSGRTLELIELARRLRESRRVPAVVLDIDSPGGSATASDELLIAFERLGARKPLVASIRGTGASGAYLAAMAARRILANPNAIVGSIGVISAGPRLPRLLDRIGVTVRESKAGRLKGMGAPWRDETDEERAKEQRIVDQFYAAFVERVAKGRHMTPERVRELATGEIWLGSEALALGLVDEIGDLERAIEVAAAMAGVPPRSAPVRIRRPLLGRLIERLTGSMAAAVADELEARFTDRFRA